MAVSFNGKHLAKFIRPEEYEAIYPQVELAHNQLESKTGAGNDFLGWLDLPVTYDKEEFARIKEAAQKIASDYLREKVSSVGHGLAATELVLEPVDWNVDHSNMDAVVDYYYTLLDLKAELLRQDLTGNEIYDAVIEKTGLLKDSVDTYVQSIYDETSATYVLQNGIPTTVEELEKFRTYLNQTIGDMFNFDDGSDSLSDLINGWLSDSGFSDLLAQAAETAASEDPFTPYTAKLEKLTDTVSALKSRL